MKLSLLAILALFVALNVHADKNKITVYKTPNCGCCQKWVDHMNDNDYEPKVISLDDLSEIKTRFGVAGRYQSCHTGVIHTDNGDYVFEGHVPAQFVDEFMTNPPKGALGLSVPGMPIGSPGMEVGDRKDYYQVLTVNKDGSSLIFAHVNKKP